VIAGTSKATVTSKIIKGSKRALKAYKINSEANIISYADYDYQMAYEKTRTLLKNNFSITSFFLWGYEMKPACLKAVKDSSLSVPEDISIICYIENEIILLLDPPITADRTDRKRSVLSAPDASLLALRVSAFAPPIKANRAACDSPKKIGKANPFSASLAAHPAPLCGHTMIWERKRQRCYWGVMEKREG
jgi:hypothetical protein